MKNRTRSREEIVEEIKDEEKNLNGFGNHCAAYGVDEAIEVFGRTRDDIIESLKRLDAELARLVTENTNCI